MSAGLLGNVQSSCVRFLLSGPRNKDTKKDLNTLLKLTTQVWTYLVNLKLATVQGEFEAAAVIESLSPRGSNQQR